MAEDSPQPLSSFGEFLSLNSVQPGGILPLVHGTPAYHIKSIGKSNKIVASPCEVFVGDNLNYLFVGRPAYKRTVDEGETPFWELPCCFIFDFKTIGEIKRIFPFDSGAFVKGLYPSYISMMGADNFEVSAVNDAPSRIIGAFFGDAKKYLELKPKGDHAFEAEFELSPLDAEVRAIHRLALEKQASSFDDRRLTIEMQTTGDIDLTVTKPLAVIAPNVYFNDKAFLYKVETEWGAQPIGYNLHPLNLSAYYTQIYEQVAEFYRKIGAIS